MDSSDDRSHAHLPVERFLRPIFEAAQDLIVASLCVIVLAIMTQSIWALGRSAFFDMRDATVVLSQIVFVLILVELFRTLIFYLVEHRVSVSLMLEIAIVSVLREVVLNPPTALSAQQALGNSVLLFVLGGLLLADRYLTRGRRMLHRHDRSRPFAGAEENLGDDGLEPPTLTV
jgi:uncharacterized membrane protein (DUF373 family)